MCIGTAAIRALFDREKPPVPAQEWDDAAYVAQRLRAYSDALATLAQVLAMPPDDVDFASAIGAVPRGATHGWSLSCPRTGDRLLVDFRDSESASGTLREDIERAIGCVFADANAWRRNLLPAYFERHRSWRAVAGAPIQH
ncbi:MAG TPA: hypothetical protein VGE10_14160 [Zeimonas sp.]